MCEKMFLLSEMKIKFSVEQKVFIVRIYYTTKSYKKVREKFLAKYSDWNTLRSVKYGSQQSVCTVFNIPFCGTFGIPCSSFKFENRQQKIMCVFVEHLKHKFHSIF